MSATKLPDVVKDPPARAVSTAGQAAEMESEGQGQATSVPPRPSDARSRKRAKKGTERAGSTEPVDPVEESAAADQAIDTAGTEMDEKR